MALGLDHIVLYVSDLQTAMRDFREAGFRLQYGGQHSDGKTENALILFADGSYLELLALTEGSQREEAGFKQLLRETGEGITGYALHSDDLVSDLNQIESAGLYVSPILQGGRARPDGLMLKWRISLIDNAMSPFVIQDDSPREWRVPAFGDDVLHPNGALGIQSLNIHCSNYDASLKRYEAISGTVGSENGTHCRFPIGRSDVLLYRNPHYQEAIHEDIVSINLLKLTSIPQRINLHGAAFVLTNPT